MDGEMNRRRNNPLHHIKLTYQLLFRHIHQNAPPQRKQMDHPQPHTRHGGSVAMPETLLHTWDDIILKGVFHLSDSSILSISLNTLTDYWVLDRKISLTHLIVRIWMIFACFLCDMLSVLFIPATHNIGDGTCSSDVCPAIITASYVPLIRREPSWLAGPGTTRNDINTG